MLKISKIHHVALLTTPELYDVTKNFYTKILGFEIIGETYREKRKSYKLDLAIQGHYQIELFSFSEYKERASYPEAKGLRHLAFEVSDLEEALQVLNQNGIQNEGVRIDEETRKKFTFFNDPNGQPLELYED